jgi:hypothetical protein
MKIRGIFYYYNLKGIYFLILKFEEFIFDKKRDSFYFRLRILVYIDSVLSS